MSTMLAGVQNLRVGVDPRHDQLWQAVMCRDLPEIRRLVEVCGVSVNIFASDGWNDKRACGSGGKSLMHHAAWVGDLPTFKYLVEQGGDPLAARQRNWKRARGNTPFHQACFYGREEIVRYCVDELGVDVDMLGENSWVPLHFAAKFGHTSICRFLLERGATVDIYNVAERSPLDLASGDDIKVMLGAALEEQRSRNGGPMVELRAGKPSALKASQGTGKQLFENTQLLPPTAPKSSGSVQMASLPPPSSARSNASGFSTSSGAYGSSESGGAPARMGRRRRRDSWDVTPKIGMFGDETSTGIPPRPPSQPSKMGLFSESDISVYNKAAPNSQDQVGGAPLVHASAPGPAPRFGRRASRSSEVSGKITDFSTHSEGDDARPSVTSRGSRFHLVGNSGVVTGGRDVLNDLTGRSPTTTVSLVDPYANKENETLAAVAPSSGIEDGNAPWQRDVNAGGTRSHTHFTGYGSQNMGNVLGDRPCVRQSELYRKYESGNTMKDLLGGGNSNLTWNVKRSDLQAA